MACGSSPHGQSHETVLAQVCAEVLDIPPEEIWSGRATRRCIPYGGGTYGSRSAVTAGNAVHLAAVKLRDRVLEVAAEVLGTGRDRLTLQGGRILRPGPPS